MRASFRRKIAALIFLPGLAFAASGDGAARMEHIAQVYARDGFSGSVLVSREGKIMLEKGYGSAVDTPHPIGAIGMQFTAAALLLLQQDGMLHLDDPLSAYLPDIPAGWSKITLRLLLIHRSGLGNDATLQAPEVDKRFELSPAGYALLARAVEKAGGMPFRDFLDKRLFAPLGMKSTGLRAEDGGIVSTVQDLATWETALYGGKVLSPESVRAMTTPPDGGLYGLGLYVLPDTDGPFYGHDGGDGVLGYRPKDRTIVAVLGKSPDMARDLANNLSDVAHGKKVVLQSERTSTARPMC